MAAPIGWPANPLPSSSPRIPASIPVTSPKPSPWPSLGGRRFPNAVIWWCLRQQFVEISDQLLIGRINLGCDFGFHALLEIFSLLVGQLVDLHRARLE